MTKIDIISGFLGAGKTTLIKKLIAECFSGEKVVLVENEFGEIGIDGGFLKDAGIEISEINSGCICCSLVGDFKKALTKVVEDLNPDRIVIEPSGVGKLSDIIRAVESVDIENVKLNSFTAVADGTKCKMYMKNFGEFFNDQIENAHTVVLSRTQKMNDAKLEETVALIREHNKDAIIITTPWDDLNAKDILAAMEHDSDMLANLMEEAKKARALLPADDDDDDDDECDDPDCECHHHHDDDGEHEHHHHHHHHHDDNDEEHEHHHHHHDDDDEHEHHHHHHDDDDEHEHHHHHHDDDDEHEHHHHHHDDDEEHGHHHHHHHHHHGHDADEVFVSWGTETPHKFAESDLDAALKVLAAEENTCGAILRAKGIVPCTDGSWLHFDLTPGEYEIRRGAPDYTGRLCVIGSGLDEEKIEALFGLH